MIVYLTLRDTSSVIINYKKKFQEKLVYSPFSATCVDKYLDYLFDIFYFCHIFYIVYNTLIKKVLQDISNFFAR